jgi:hypothetical protein
VSPPVVAEALIAAFAARNEFESVAGDLHEEYLRYARANGTRAANRWYWSQVLLSIPSLLSYSRARRSALRTLGSGLVGLAILIAMMLATLPINWLLAVIFGSPDRSPLWFTFCAFWMDALLFGAVLALIVRNDGVRIAFFAASFFVLCFAVPALLGNASSQAPLVAWIVLGGVVPAMCIGAGLFQAAIRNLIARKK